MDPTIIFGVIVIVIVLLVGGFIAAQKRREAMTSLAARLGLRFDPHKDRSLPGRYHFLNELGAGSNQYAHNILSGTYHDHDIMVFDYHYRTGSGNTTEYHHISFFMLNLPGYFPELVIGPEDLSSKIAQALGYDDIDFESHEFSRKFCVRSADKKFAYDVCNARMIEFLLANRGFSIEIEENVLAISFDRRLAPEAIEPNLQRLIQVRSLMPDYLFSGRYSCGWLH